MHPANNLNLPAYPLAATRRIRANRVGLGNLERYLDSIPNDDDGGAGGGGGAAQQNEAWMNDVGLALAATKHRERRETRTVTTVEQRETVIPRANPPSIGVGPFLVGSGATCGAWARTPGAPTPPRIRRRASGR